MSDSPEKQPDGKLKYHRSYVDRHGKRRHYFRRGNSNVALPGPLGSQRFIKAYLAALTGAALPPQKKNRAIESIDRSVNGNPPKMGVYLLLLNGRIVYIGSSFNMQKRVADHRTAGRPFDQVFYIGTKRTERLVLEHALISALAPMQNFNGVKMRRDRELPAGETGCEVTPEPA